MLLSLLFAGGCTQREEPCPTIEGVQEEGATAVVPLWSGEAHALVVTGTGFSALPGDARGEESPRIPEVRVGGVALVDVTWSPEALEGTLPADTLEPGFHDVVVTNPVGCEARLADAVEITDTPPPHLDEGLRVDLVTPPFGWTGQATAVTISGDGFVSTPRVFLSAGPFVVGVDTELEQVAFLSSGSLTGVVPAGLPVGGPYDVVVLNPDNGYNLLDDAFTVTEAPPPDILAVTPAAGTTQEDTPLAVTGESFDPGAEVVLVDAAGTETAVVATVTSDTAIDATAPSSSMTVGAYLVRVRNPDGSYDDHAAFVVRNPSAKLGTAGAWGASPSLDVARAAPGLLSRVDALGRGWLWVAGGDDGSAPLSTVERAQVDAFGELSAWAMLGTELGTPRADAAWAELDGFLYAIGGDDGTGPLDTVERAAVLDGDAGVRPEITEATPSLDGELAAGAWYYRVSAVMAADDPYNPGGESLASEVEVVRLVAGEGTVTLAWDPVAGAVGYRVYRTDAADGAAGQEHRVADELADTTWTDDGVAAGTEAYVPDGGLGVWVTLEERLPAPVAHGVAVVAADPDGVRRIYVVGGTSDGAAPSGVVWMRDEDGVWVEAGALTLPRLDHGAFAVGPADAEELADDDPTWIVAMQGDTGDGADPSVEVAAILAGGLLADFGELSNLDARGQARVDLVGHAATGWMYALGGGGDATDAQDSGRQSSIDGPGLEMGSWSSTSDSGTFTTPRADFGLVPLRAALYAAGGRTDTDAATTSVEQVVY